MERPKILKLVLFVVFMVLNPKIECQVILPPIAPRPLCISQFALANHACSKVPFTLSPPPSPPSPPPSPPTPAPPGPQHRHVHHSHHHRHRHVGSAVEQICCHWLTVIDVECVCDVLVHLPPVLSRPLHQYTVTVGEVCTATFQCASRMEA